MESLDTLLQAEPPPFSPTKTQDLFAENLAYLNMLCSVSLIILKKLRSGKKKQSK